LARRGEVAGITLRSAVGNPTRDHGNLRVRDPALPDELAVALKGLPRRHAPLLQRREDLVSPPVDMLVLDQFEGRAAARPVALLAVLLEQGRNLSIEGHAGRGGGLAGQARSGAAGQDAEHDKQESEPHAYLL